MNYKPEHTTDIKNLTLLLLIWTAFTAGLTAVEPLGVSERAWSECSTDGGALLAMPWQSSCKGALHSPDVTVDAGVGHVVGVIHAKCRPPIITEDKVSALATSTLTACTT